MSQETRELVCINCPMGCRLEVQIEQGQVIQVLGHACVRGERYARDEVQRPMRMVTSVILVPGSREPLSVKTKTPIPKDLIFPCLLAIRACRVSLPVRIGDVIIKNVLETGVDVVATRNLPDLPYGEKAFIMKKTP